VDRFGAAADKSGNNAPVPQTIDNMMRAQHQDRRLLEITPPRIAPFMKHENDFRARPDPVGSKDTMLTLLALLDPPG
jgi:hypothetical protein